MTETQNSRYQPAVELLAPAGSVETMKAAFRAGADAVYIGGASFGARAYADNPGQDDLVSAIRYAHLIGKRIHLTVNTLLKQEELADRLVPFLKPYYEEGLDAVIVQDPGVMQLLRCEFPDLPVHVSTQAAVSGPLAVRKFAEMGAARIILPRELSLEEIRQIRRSTDLELEVFIHGAVCYCYSGLCLFSSLAGGRSGNRGRCAQPCRKPYELYRGDRKISGDDPLYLLNLKDMNTIRILPQIVRSGVNSLKIEGRMKTPEYTAGVVSIYRKYLDRILENPDREYQVSRQDLESLFDLFNRGGFSGGYFLQHNGREMISLANSAHKKENPQLSEKIAREYLSDEVRVPAAGKLTVRAGAPAVLEVSAGGTSVRAAGEEVLPARSRPMTVRELRERMEKIHDTPFEWKTLSIDTDGSSFIPVGKLNELRRAAFAQLEENLAAGCRRKFSGSPVPVLPDAADEIRGEGAAAGEAEPRWIACVSSREQLKVCLKYRWISALCLSWDLALGNGSEAVRTVRSAGMVCGAELPRMVRGSGEERIGNGAAALAGEGVRFFLASTAEGLLLAGESAPDALILADHTLYAWNTAAEKVWLSRFGADRVSVPAELNRSEILRRGVRGMDFVIYGRMPMMITAQCVNRTVNGCTGKPEDLTLRDRMGNRFPVRNFCGECYNMIYNSVPQCIPEAVPDLSGRGLASFRAVFTVEDAERTAAVLDYLAAVRAGNLKERPEFPFTRGHYRRGVE